MLNIRKLDNPIRVRCINNKSLEEELILGQTYMISQTTINNYIINDFAYVKSRFEIVEDDNDIQNQLKTNNKTYWYYASECYDAGKLSNAFSCIIDSDNNMFPYRKAEENMRSKGHAHIEYKTVIQISKEDYEWKHAQMSKFGGNDG